MIDMLLLFFSYLPYIYVINQHLTINHHHFSFSKSHFLAYSGVFDYDKNGNLLPSTLPNLYSDDGKLMMMIDEMVDDDCEMRWW